MAKTLIAFFSRADKEFEKVKKKHLNSQMVEGRILRCVSEEVRIV